MMRAVMALSAAAGDCPLHGNDRHQWLHSAAGDHNIKTINSIGVLYLICA
jgi:hypothetical protein